MSGQKSVGHHRQRLVFAHRGGVHTTGNLVWAHVTFQGGIETYHLVNETNNLDHTYIDYYAGTPDGHAEFINERVCWNGTLRQIPAWYGNNPFTGAQSAYSGHWHAGGEKDTFVQLQMLNGSPTYDHLLDPGSWDASGQTFNNPWTGHYGTAGELCGS